MANKKKKSGKPKQQHIGHYCRICGEYKANEKFSGSGHAAHICKSCASKSPARKSEDMTINKLHGMMFRYLSESEIKWLRNRRNDSRPEVSELARQVFEERFPRQARNEIKQQLHIKSIVFHVRGEVYDGYGDEYVVDAEYAADTTGKIVKKAFDDNGVAAEEKSVDVGVKAARKFFNVMVHNYDVPFWDEDLCHDDSYDPDMDDDFDFDDSDSDESGDNEEQEQPDGSGDEEQDDRIPAWSIEIQYKNETGQSIKGYDCIPDPVLELFGDFDGYFAEDLPDDEFDNEDD
jgi:hypothetical protein